MNTLYDRKGKATAYVHTDNEHIYLYNGEPVAFLRAENVYSFKGRYLGWIDNGWFYDRKANPAFFTVESTGGPSKPSRQSKPSRSSIKSRPSKSSRESRPSKPSKSSSWSELSNESYFDQ